MDFFSFSKFSFYQKLRLNLSKANLQRLKLDLKFILTISCGRIFRFLSAIQLIKYFKTRFNFRAVFLVFLGLGSVFFVSGVFAEGKVDSTIEKPIPNESQFQDLVLKIDQLRLYESSQWRAMLVYADKRNRSLVSHSAFFLNPEGMRNSRSEMLAQLQTILNPKPNSKPDDDPICLFPARRKFLQSHLNLPKDTLSENCPTYKRYLRTLEADSVSFVFSSFYTNSPGSAFGHTLFRIHKKGAQAAELLDHGIGYAANVTTNNSFLYAVYGIGGLFQGTYTNVPYYYKIREYNDYESRDLWTYHLDLKPAEVELLVDHLWEIGQVSLDYYFFTKNCSYLMLVAIEAATDRYQLRPKLPFWVIPSDSLKTVTDTPGLVNKIEFRPAARTQFHYRYSVFSPAEKNELKNFLEKYEPSQLEKFSDKKKVAFLDAAIDSIDMRFPENLIKEDSEGSKIKSKLLKVRAAVPLVSEPLNVPPPTEERPDLGHGSFRWSLAARQWNQKWMTLIEARFAMHDLGDPHLGYPRFSQIEFFNFRGEISSTSTFRVLDFDFFQAASINPRTSFNKQISWRGRMGATSFGPSLCQPDCLAPSMQVAAGWAFSVGPQDSLVIWPLIDTGVFNDYRLYGGPWMTVVGPGLVLLWTVRKNIKFIQSSTYFPISLFSGPNLVQKHQSELRWHANNSFQIFARGEIWKSQVGDDNAGHIGVMYSY